MAGASQRDRRSQFDGIGDRRSQFRQNPYGIRDRRSQFRHDPGIDEVNYETRYIVNHRPRFLLLPAEATGTCGHPMGSDY